MHRHALTDDQWRRLQAVIPKQKASPPEAARGDRLFIDAVLFRAKTGMPWRDHCRSAGPWKSVYNRFSNWAKKGHWEAIFEALQLEVDDVGSIIVDGSVHPRHQDAAGGKGGPKQCPRPFSRRFLDQASRRCRSTKGRPIHIALTPGQRHEDDHGA